MPKKLSKQNSDDSSGEETDNELLDVNDGDDEIDLKLLRDDDAEDEESDEELQDDKDVSSNEDADNEENEANIEQTEQKEQLESAVKSNQQLSSKITTEKQSHTGRKDSQKDSQREISQQSTDLNAKSSTNQTEQTEGLKETNLDEIGEKNDNKRKKLSSQFVSSKKSKKSIKKSIKKRPSSKSTNQAEQKLEQMSTNELLKTKLRQVKKSEFVFGCCC